jgi:menaquinone-specific isochorismate synthase
MEWCNAVHGALARIGANTYQKIVLARRASFRFGAPLQSGWFLRRLRSQVARSFLFCFQPDATHAFLGASPERLYRRDDRLLRTEAIAGTRPRYADPGRDRAAGEALLQDEKDRREHQYVVDGIGEALDAVVEDWGRDPKPELLKLTHAQHLVTRFRGVLRDDVTDGDLLRALHPTPAVGGYPRRPAVAEIPGFEQFDRGYFAAPVGWVEREAAQFAVGIRSGLIEAGNLHLYSGAGLVAGSDCAEEWEEIENKIADFMDILPGGVAAPAAGEGAL